MQRVHRTHTMRLHLCSGMADRRAKRLQDCQGPVSSTKSWPDLVYRLSAAVPGGPAGRTPSVALSRSGSTQGGNVMNRRIVVVTFCAVIPLLVSACATKKFVREQVGTTETKITQRVDTQETKLRETSDQVATQRQALDATGQKVQGLDSRVGEVNALATDAKSGAEAAKKQAESVSGALKETQTEFTQRFANRNKLSELQAMSVYFDFDKTNLKDQGMTELEEVARALKADPNAVLELQGFADPRGSDRYNNQLTRERVDAVVRYLVQRHGIDLRRIHAVGMAKEVRAAGEKATKDSLAKSRRVAVHLLAPQSCSRNTRPRAPSLPAEPP